jgi:hypothetical protein
LAAVVEFGDDWKSIMDKLGCFKTKRELILEFLRIPISDGNRDDHQYLVIHA